MIAVSCRFSHSFNIMRMRHTIVPVSAPPDPVRVLYSGSNDTMEKVTYIFCLNERVPKMYKIWALNAQGVREVHLFAQVRFFNNFIEDTFKTFFFNSRRFRIPFTGQRSLKNSVEFIRFAQITLNVEVVIYTPNIFVHNWGTNPTMIYPTVSNITRRAYNHITTQRVFVLQCNHERLRLKRV